MKSSLFVTAALACTLASAVTAQQVEQVQTSPTKAGKATQTKATQINMGATGSKSTSGVINPRPGSFMPLVGGAAETCAGATAISGPGTYNGNNTGAVLESQVNCAAAAEVGDVWYSWTATTTGSEVMTFCVLTDAAATADFDTLLAVYNASCGGALLACNDDGPGCDPGPGTGTVPGDWTSTVQFGVTAGNVYKLQIAGFDAGSGFGTYSLVIKPTVAPPANDNCAAPAALGAGPGPHAFDNTNGTSGPQHQAEAACSQFAVTAVNADLWYTWGPNPNPTGSLRLSACAQGNTVDTKMGAYNGAAGCPAGAAVGCNDDLCGLQAQVDFPGTVGNSYTFQIGTYPGGVAGDQGLGVYGGPGTFTIVPTPTGPPNDDCANASGPLFGPGPHNFDTSTANTGTIGQDQALCQSNPGGMAINNDQWIKWSAFATGQATLNTCTLTTVDTKIAVYPVSPCPTVGVQSALACNDDNCPAALQSSLCFPVTNGTQYMIQMGTFPGATGGAGQFGVTIGASGVTACKRDDGQSDNMLGWTAGGNMAWIQRFDLGASVSVSSIQVAWGSAAFPGATPPNGSPARVLLYEDTDTDNDPSTNLVLKQNVLTTVANVDTDTLNTVSVPSTLMNGIFFAGAAEDHAAGQFVAVMDQTCPQGNESWFFGDNAAVPATNFANPAASPIPVDSFLANGFACNLIVRTCVTSPMTGACFPGTGGVINCPCPTQAPANPSGGCRNHGTGFTSGGVLSATGVADVSADTLSITSSGMRPAATVLNVFFSYKPGGATPTPGTVSNAGIRCSGAGGSLKRLYTGNATGGSITRPGMGDLSVSAQSATFAGHAIVAPETRYYFNVYRDGQASTAGCPSGSLATTNLTNMGIVNWVP